MKLRWIGDYGGLNTRIFSCNYFLLTICVHLSKCGTVLLRMGGGKPRTGWGELWEVGMGGCLSQGIGRQRGGGLGE